MNSNQTLVSLISKILLSLIFYQLLKNFNNLFIYEDLDLVYDRRQDMKYEEMSEKFSEQFQVLTIVYQFEAPEDQSEEDSMFLKWSPKAYHPSLESKFNSFY